MPQLIYVHTVNIIADRIYVFASYGEQVTLADMFSLQIHVLDNTSPASPLAETRESSSEQHLLYLSKKFLPVSSGYMYVPQTASAPVVPSIAPSSPQHSSQSILVPTDSLQQAPVVTALRQQIEALKLRIAKMEIQEKESNANNAQITFEMAKKADNLEKEKSSITEMYVSSIQKKQEQIDSLEKENRQLKKELQEAGLQMDKIERKYQTIFESQRQQHEKESTKQTDQLKAICKERDTLLGVGLEDHSLTDLVRLHETLKISKAKVKVILSEKKDSMLCLTCVENPKNMVFIPCGHLCICEKCYNNNQQSICLICRTQGIAYKTFI